MSFLKIDNVSKSFVTRNGPLEVLRNFSLEIKEGEFVCLVGPSGCGKTTLLGMIAGLEKTTSGRITHKGVPVSGPSSERIVIFQDLALFPWLNAQKNVEFGLRVKGVPGKERERIALEYLAMVNLSKFKDLFIHELSGGMKQRVALARALATDPEILLMDEPFAALDAQTRDKLHEELQRIWAKTKKTIVFVTHNVREAVCLGDRVVALSAQPAQIKASYDVNLIRPRHIESDGVIDIVRVVLLALKAEIDKAAKKETND